MNTTQQRAVSIGELKDWILSNRRGCAFKDYTAHRIICQITSAANNNTIAYVLDTNQQLCGVGIGHLVGDTLFFVDDVLITQKSSLKILVEWLKQQYPKRTIIGLRHMKSVHIFNNPNKLLKYL